MELPANDHAASFTRFQRMLLGTDGTVTHILEAYADEPVEVVKLLQVYDTARDVDRAMGMASDERILRRHVILRGARSGTHLLYAEAIVAPVRVDAAVLDGLLGTDKPIGVLLTERRTETFREILRVGREPAGEVGAHFGLGAAAELISRTYVIVTDGRPVILITEKFPGNYFRDIPA
jgi:chorismate-pyruvate lyase